MTLVEVSLFLEGMNKRSQEGWEQTRTIAYIIAQANSTKRLKKTDILCFPWDEEEIKQPKATPEELERLKQRAKQIEKQLNH